jgi:nucleotide-binding universal stress UspA family protein
MSSGDHPDLRNERRTFALIAAGVDGYPEGRDAAALGAAIAQAAGAELMLVAVHPDPLVVLPREMGWTAMRERAGAELRSVRDELSPDARTVVETDWSVPRALERVVRREHRDLLVVGSSRDGPEGRVRIGRCTRQLLGDAACALGVAPRGLAAGERLRLANIGVGYDGGPESQAALNRAGALAVAADAKLHVLAIVDDRLPAVGWSPEGGQQIAAMWRELLEPTLQALREDAQQAAAATGADVRIGVTAGAPADALIALSEEVDLLMIGSRRWGAVARVLLGSVGEALIQSASCPVIVVPRPHA